ncbi:hypothetical protein SAMN04487957_110146 [Halomonas shengliensis]|uniref:Phage-related minor tail protein n=1 Tax=Halomonas shengliensis TaxID=419597 RepID=A0A1H0LXW8_9GAMM|nr:hypothetical protein [Halomonas shengliensis]SDO72923.1 hypothetical protein SAMN04487957_110146 [Halomonas shengliensis]
MATNSLGQLTLDLVAKTGSFVAGMNKSQRSAAKWRKGVERDLKRVGTAFAALGVAAGGALAGAVVQTANQARELQNLARLSDTSTQQFQKMAYGAGRFGIEQDKLADILKDTNDRVGDFIATGGGPMADFFENIAPQVGVTADEFARLSGPEALQLYVSSLEAAGLSQKDMTFYMEAIASDATALIPLLANNGEEMRRLGDEAERTGNVFSELEMDQLEAIKTSMDELTGAATGMKNEMVLEALPAIEEFSELLKDPQTLESARALGEAIVTAMGWAASAIRETVGAAQALGRELGVIAAGIGGLELEEQKRRILSALDDPGERLRFFGPDGLVTYYSEDELRAELARINQQIEQNAARYTFDIEGGADPGDGRSIMEVFLGEGLELADKGFARVGAAADAAAEALEGFSPSQSEEVDRILEAAGPGATIDAEGQIRDAWGNTLPTLQRQLDAELKRQVDAFKTDQNLAAGLEAAAQAFIDGASEAAKAAWASVVPQAAGEVVDGVLPTGDQGSAPIRWSDGVAKVSEAAGQVGGETAAPTGGRDLGTLHLVNDKGERLDVLANPDAAESWLADVLSGAAAGSPSR